MQQTETYNLNIIETDDTFSPDALNANARALETHLARMDAAAATETARVNAHLARVDSAAAAETARVDAQLARLDAALARVDAAAATIPKFAYGTYTGDGTYNRLIELPFSPKWVIVTDITGSTFDGSRFTGGMAIEGFTATVNYQALVKITDGGFEISHWSTQTPFPHSINMKDTEYRYFAIG